MQFAGDPDALLLQPVFILRLRQRLRKLVFFLLQPVLPPLPPDHQGGNHPQQYQQDYRARQQEIPFPDLQQALFQGGILFLTLVAFFQLSRIFQHFFFR
ncbi:hypothetical protein FQZ97_1053700 [compost metagenome]